MKVVAETTHTRPTRHRAERGTDRRDRGFRPDIEGLRAVAVGLVLLYHAGLPFIRGGFVGVDVFFVISGFLITGMLVREVERTGRLSLANFYARRAKRLLPAAGVVLVAAGILTWLFLPRTDWRDFGGDIVGSALYLINWRLADRSVDYLAEDVGASPVQHYWSLAIEEQFYLLWPFLVLLAAWWIRRSRMSLRLATGVALLLVAVPSLYASVVMTANDQGRAYFVTTTRLWELALGAGLAITASLWENLPRRAAVALGWIGLLAVIASGVLYSATMAWPGTAALLPTLGAAAVIASGAAAGDQGPEWVLGRGLMLWIGALSYSLYLWHWPLIVAATGTGTGLPPLVGLGIVLLCVLPAWLTYLLVENPLRFSTAMSRTPRLALRVGAAFSLVGVVAGFALVQAATLSARPAGTVQVHGAEVLGDVPANYAGPGDVDVIVPDPVVATEDVPDAYAAGCQAPQTSAVVATCEYGDPSGDITVALVGDSKALQWISAFDKVGSDRGWRVVTYTKSACSFTDAVITLRGELYQTCTEWTNAVHERLISDRPDLVVTSQGRSAALNDPADVSQGESRNSMVSGLRSRWTALIDARLPVVVMRDNPGPPADVRPVYECVAERPDDLDLCTFEQAAGGSADDVQLEAANDVPAVDVVDLIEYVCPGGKCLPVIGNVLVYRQGSHLTKTFVDSLAPRLDEALTPLVESSGQR